MPPQDDFQKKVLETLKKNLRAVDLSEEEEQAAEVPTVEAVEAVEAVEVEHEPALLE